jgi:hypothetical protein
LLVPFVENFDSYSKLLRVSFIAILIFQFYTQMLGSSVNTLIYANLIGGLGLQWKEYVFSWKYSAFGVYPLLLIKYLSGIEIPISGISNNSSSIVPYQTIDYLWANTSSVAIKCVDIILAVVFSFNVIKIIKKVGLVGQLRRYAKPLTIIFSVFLFAFILLFIPKALFTRTKMVSVSILNPGFEIFENAFPVGWHLIDWSKRTDVGSVTITPDMNDYCEGTQSLAMQINQDYVTISLASTDFNVVNNEIVIARCKVKEISTKVESIRIAFINAKGDVIYWSTTTGVRDISAKWKELESSAIAPKGTVKAEIWLNIWAGGLTKGDKILFDDVRIQKRI